MGLTHLRNVPGIPSSAPKEAASAPRILRKRSASLPGVAHVTALLLLTEVSKDCEARSTPANSSELKSTPLSAAIASSRSGGDQPHIVINKSLTAQANR